MEDATFGPYELRGLLGRGGMGEVYEAFDREQNRVVALKLLPKALIQDEGFVERFRRESFAAARLSDPHVIPIHRYGDIDGRHTIVIGPRRSAETSAWCSSSSTCSRTGRRWATSRWP
jgi:serine/threonine protein kinase